MSAREQVGKTAQATKAAVTGATRPPVHGRILATLFMAVRPGSETSRAGRAARALNRFTRHYTDLGRQQWTVSLCLSLARN